MRAKKSLGQNFLVDRTIQRRIIEALEPRADDEILEIGPGTGALTAHLVGAVRRLVAVELDDRLVDGLRAEYGHEVGVEIVHGDVLEMTLETVAEDPARLKVVANLPYYITTPILFWLLERRPRPASIVVMVQREVADRIAAEPGGKEYGALSVGVRAVADVERLFTVGRGAFRPVPKVDSAVLAVRPHRPPRLDERTERDVRSLVRTAFGWRRKQLQKILRAAPGYDLDHDAVAEVERATGIDATARPETLSPDDFARLAAALRRRGLPKEAGPG